MAKTPYDDALALFAGSLARSKELLASRIASKDQHYQFLRSAGERVTRFRALLARPVYTGGPPGEGGAKKKRSPAKR